MAKPRRSLRSVLLGGACALAALAAAAAPALAAPYTVRQGDTYWALARQYGTSVAALEAANPHHPAWALSPGLVLDVPGAAGRSAVQLPATSATVNLLARAASAEEGNRSLQDQIGVDAVVLNRTRSGQFPKTVSGVLFQPGQFTSVSNGYFWDTTVTARSVTAAQDALAGEDPTGGALYFYDPGQGVSDAWIYSRGVTAVIDGTVYAA